jgi:hypothetical protein
VNAEPLKAGDWVVDKDDNYTPIFGKVKKVWFDGTLDLIVYSSSGERIGRRSPPEGGPTSYEPCLTADRFVKIEEPDFPLKVSKFTRNYAHLLRRVP